MTEKPSWERSLERIRRGEKQEWERRNPRFTPPRTTSEVTVPLKCDPAEILRFMANVHDAQFRRGYAAATGEGDEEQYEVFI